MCLFVHQRTSTNTLMDDLDVLLAHTYSSNPPQVPSCFTGQILNHDSTEYNELSFDIVDNAVVR